MAKPSYIISHWSTMLEGLEASPLEFFNAVELAIGDKNIPSIKLSRFVWKEGGILSAKREYLLVRRKDHVYDICGAPFGNGFFVSSWLGEQRSGVLAFLFGIPLLGRLLQSLFKPTTYYQHDTALMFQALVHSAVTEVVDSLTKAKGLRALSDDERKPEIRNFFGQ
jgi:hypothetical protein